MSAQQLRGLLWFCCLWGTLLAAAYFMEDAMKRKLTVVLLCVLLVLSAMPASIFAATYTIKDDITNSGSLQIEGYDGSGEVT